MSTSVWISSTFNFIISGSSASPPSERQKEIIIEPFSSCSWLMITFCFPYSFQCDSHDTVFIAETVIIHRIFFALLLSVWAGFDDLEFKAWSWKWCEAILVAFSVMILHCKNQLEALWMLMLCAFSKVTQIWAHFHYQIICIEQSAVNYANRVVTFPTSVHVMSFLVLYSTCMCMMLTRFSAAVASWCHYSDS